MVATYAFAAAVLLSRNPDICAAELDGEVCLFNPESAEYLNLNATGSCIWNLLAQPVPLRDLVFRLEERYAVDHGICQEETERFVEDALQKGMLHANRQA